MAIRNQPTNLNQLNVVSFETNFLRMPSVSYFCQRVNIPGITLSNTIQSTPFANIPIEGDILEFEDLTIGFIVDEDMQNYLELYNKKLDPGLNMVINSLSSPSSFTFRIKRPCS